MLAVRSAVLFLLGGFIVACSGGGSSTASGGAGAGGSGGGSGAGSTYPKPCSDLYDPTRLVQFDLKIAPDQLTLMERDCTQKVKQYRPATLRYGSETVDVMVRLKGNWSWRCDKKQFLVSFNETDPQGRFHGLRKLVFDAPWYDVTLLAERMGASFMHRVGAQWSCVNHAKLFLNGEYYGLYANVERLDKEYLQRHFPDAEADGNLYDGGVELRTNEGVADVSRRDELMASVCDLATIERLVDLNQAIRVWAASALLPDPDSYWAGVEINYYLYDHPTRGFLFFPYDMDMTMLAGSTDVATSSVRVRVLPELVSADPFTYENSAWKREPLLQTVLASERYCSQFVSELRSARQAYDPVLMTSELDAWAAQIDDALRDDPNKPYSYEDHLAAIATVKSFMSQRVAFIDGWLAKATCPVLSKP
ncbi:MAG: CotH kinase family protein [Polyangiaceae bacterium]